MNLSLASFIELPTKLFQLYMGENALWPSYGRKLNILAVWQRIEYTQYLKKAVAGPFSISSSF